VLALWWGRLRHVECRAVPHAETIYTALSRLEKLNASILLVLVFAVKLTSCHLLIWLYLMWKSEAIHLNRCAGIWWTIGASRLDFLCQYKVWIFRRFKQKTGSRVRFNEILVVSRPWAACLIFRRCIVSFGDRLLGILVCWTHTPIQLRSESHVRHVRSLVYSVDGIFDAEKDRLFRLPQLRQIALLLIERWGHFFRSGNVTLTLETILTGAEHALFCLRVHLKFLWWGHVGPAVLL